MVSELERLKADLEVLQRHQGYSILENAIADLADKIARLEAEADPWREAKCMIEGWRKDILAGRHVSHAAQNAVHHFDHLTAEVDRLTKRVAELEAEPEFTPAVLKRAEEIVVGDVILASGLIRTVTEIGGNHPDRRIIRCEVWMAWFGNQDLIAVLRQPLVEAKTLKPSGSADDDIDDLARESDPVLDPARVLATAEIALRAKKWHENADNIKFIWQGIDLNAKPYRLKWGTDIEAKRQEMERTAWGQGS